MQNNILTEINSHEIGNQKLFVAWQRARDCGDHEQWRMLHSCKQIISSADHIIAFMVLISGDQELTPTRPEPVSEYIRGDKTNFVFSLTPRNREEFKVTQSF